MPAGDCIESSNLIASQAILATRWALCRDCQAQLNVEQERLEQRQLAEQYRASSSAGSAAEPLDASVVAQQLARFAEDTDAGLGGAQPDAGVFGLDASGFEKILQELGSTGMLPESALQDGAQERDDSSSGSSAGELGAGTDESDSSGDEAPAATVTVKTAQDRSKPPATECTAAAAREAHNGSSPAAQLPRTPSTVSGASTGDGEFAQAVDEKMQAELEPTGRLRDSNRPAEVDYASAMAMMQSIEAEGVAGQPGAGSLLLHTMGHQLPKQ